jgi:hypothetical protein
MVVRSIQDTRLELQFCHTIPMYLRGWSSSWCWPWWRGGKEHYYSNLYATAPENFYMFLEHVSCTAAHISHQVPVSIFPSTWARVSPSNRLTKPELSHIISNAQCLEDIAVEYCNRCHLPKLEIELHGDHYTEVEKNQNPKRYACPFHTALESPVVQIKTIIEETWHVVCKSKNIR